MAVVSKWRNFRTENGLSKRISKLAIYGRRHKKRNHGRNR